MVPELTGVLSQAVVARAERYALKELGTSLLNTRKAFGAIGFLGMALTLICLSLSQQSPMATTGLLCSAQFWLALHSCGYKSNYFDLTADYQVCCVMMDCYALMNHGVQGVFMGCGNTIASVMTFSVPLCVAFLLEATSQSWGAVFMCLVMLNGAGAAICIIYTSVERLDSQLD